ETVDASHGRILRLWPSDALAEGYPLRGHLAVLPMRRDLDMDAQRQQPDETYPVAGARPAAESGRPASPPRDDPGAAPAAVLHAPGPAAPRAGAVSAAGDGLPARAAGDDRLRGRRLVARSSRVGEVER